MEVTFRKDSPRSQRPRSAIGLKSSGGVEGRVERSDVLKDTAIRASVRDDRSWIRGAGAYDETDSASNGRKVLSRRSMTLPAQRSSEGTAAPPGRRESTDSSDDDKVEGSSPSRAHTRIYSVEDAQRRVSGQQQQTAGAYRAGSAAAMPESRAETTSATRTHFQRPLTKSSSLPKKVLPRGGVNTPALASDSPDSGVVIEKRNTSVQSASVSPPTQGAQDVGQQSGKQKDNPWSNAWRKCSRCGSSLGKRTAFILEYLSLYYHEECFQCASCSCPLGHVSDGHQLRILAKKVHCDACYKKKLGV